MSKPYSTTYSRKLVAGIGSRGFFVGIVMLLVLQAAWIALSGRYPMAFDEGFHLGVIHLYAHHLSPFWNGQPATADAFGAISRDPSYLYQYLMSFPDRLITVFTDNQTVEVLTLRAINIGLFATSLPLYRRLLLKTGASRALVQACCLVFVLIPVVPLLAAQVNYDNLLLLLTALTLLMAVNFSEELRHYKRINSKLLLGVLVVGLLASLVKYAFLPVFAVLLLFIAIRLKQTYPNWQKFWLSLGVGFTLLTRHSRWLLLVLLVLATGLFAERYGVNLVRYHQPVPDCSQVLSVSACEAYGPWARDHQLELRKSPTTTQSPLVFTADWFYGMWLRSFFAVDGPATDFQTRGPFPVPGIGAIVFVAGGAIAAVAYSRRLFQAYDKRVLWLFVSVAVCYTGALWLTEYQSFLQTGQSVAINGRYLLPVLLPLLLIAALGYNELLGGRPALKLCLATVVILSLLWGGGALTYILRSNDAWYWNYRGVRPANHAVQQMLGPITPGYDNPIEFLHKN